MFLLVNIIICNFINMATKRKYNELSIERKKEVVDELNKGASVRRLGEEYNAHFSYAALLFAFLPPPV